MPGEALDKPEGVGLPPTPFLYHLDQVATLLGLTEEDLISRYLWFLGRTVGRKSPRQIKVVNIAPTVAMAEWRISEGELVRWLKLMGFKVYSRGRVV